MNPEDNTPNITVDDVFRDLEPAQRTRLEAHTVYQVYQPGHLFMSPDQHGEQVFVLKAGRVRLYKLSSESRLLTLAVLEPVTIFGEMVLAGQRMHDYFAEALTECTVGTIERDVVRDVLKQNPQVCMGFMELIGQRLREIEHKLADIAFKSVPQRLATVLLHLANVSEEGLSHGANAYTMVRYTHQQLAEMIGSYRETVTKAIGEFREAGLIRIEEDVIHLTDLDQLYQLANQ
jgi:CRP-like cAMP-binding protein